MDNDRKYFININGNNLGPLKFEEISERLGNGLLTPDDYIFLVGETDWKFIRDLEEFKGYTTPLTEPQTNKQWFVRKDKNNFGPLSVMDVNQMLESGQIDINDYAWKKGLKTWIPIKESSEFSMVSEPSAPLPSVAKELEKPALEMIKAPDAEVYIKPKKKRLMPELILGLILFCVGILELEQNELLGGLIAMAGIAVTLVFLRIKRKKDK